ncbi:tetratricopeptide repeat protein [Salinibius halmophilus]|uniref:tetratricopeptide repeat protein n=1 Tax=Salinibius halmophilus TaxID=1853216 RepID=UPI000E6763B6|nr:tetratricopeptide repeat protein [Salinibius halmophilus]
MHFRALLLIGVMAIAAGCATTNPAQQQQTQRAQQAQVDIGYAQLKRGKYQEAKAAFGRALSIDPNSAGGHFGMARIHEVELDYERAEAAFEKSLDIKSDPQVHHSFGAFYYNRGRFAEAYQQFRLASQDDFYPQRAIVFQSMGYAALQQEKLDQAVIDFGRARALDATLWTSVLAIADIEFGRGNIDAALKQVLELDRLDRADLVKANPNTLLLQIKVAHAANENSLRDAWRIRLKREFARTPQAQELRQWEADKGLS